ncbi:MAG: sugar transferase [Cyclobacteriaceae bacterium]
MKGRKAFFYISAVYLSFGKRVIDVIFGIMLLVLSSPLLGAITLVQLVHANGILFLQKRAGQNGVPFTIIKFKTMIDKKDNDGNSLPDHLRLTTWGKFLRSWSLDELPQLVNVLFGEMSLIGPRPLLPEYSKRYSDKHLKRLDVKPGLTGLAQINGRNKTSWQQRLDLDVKYVDNISLKSDMLILVRTFFKVLNADGISSSETVSMPEFTGYK